MHPDAAALQSLLASATLSGDVDAVRRLLRHGTENEPIKQSTSAPSSASLFADQPLLQIALGGTKLQLRSRRTMGKVLWPAGHAVALQIALLSKSSTLPCQASLVEIGAGAAVPSLVAAATGAFKAVLATDFVEEVVALIRHNASLNGSVLRNSTRLDVGDEQMLSRVVDEHNLVGPAAVPLLLLACDMSYDADAIANLFASMRALHNSFPSCRPLLLFSRSDNFAHMDVTTRLAAARNGFALLERTERRAPGVLDAISETHLTPCAEDAVTSFYWAPANSKVSVDVDAPAAAKAAAAAVVAMAVASGEAPPGVAAEAAAAEATLEVDASYRTHPAYEWLLGEVAEEAAADRPQQEETASADDLWAPQLSHNA